MTMREQVIKTLTEQGMFESQAEEVFERVKESTTLMQGRWNDKVEDYPDSLTAVLWLTVKCEAKEYIEEKCPEAWFRPVFDEELAKSLGL